MSLVAWSICFCLSLVHDREPCKNGWTDQDAVCGQTRVGIGNHILHVRFDGVQFVPWIGAIVTVSIPLKNIGIFTVHVRSKWIIHSSTTAWQRDCCRWLVTTMLLLLTGRCHSKFIPVKKSLRCDAACYRIALQLQSYFIAFICCKLTWNRCIHVVTL